MSYGTKYYLEHTSSHGVPYYVQLQKDGFVGDPSRLTFLRDGLVIDYNLKAWEDSVMTLVVKMNILNDASNWYDYEDLFTLEDREFKLIIDASYSGENKRIFDGWVNSSPVEQNYLNNSTINITGSNFIQKMDSVSPTILNFPDPSQGDCRSFIDFINDSLKITGKEDDIYINCRLEPSIGVIDSSSTLFNKVGMTPELWFDDNQNKSSGLDILSDILKPFNSYLYWWGGDWYIERYRDLFPSDYQKNYVKYNWDSSYGYDDDGTASLITDVSYSLPIETCDGSTKFTGSSQKISMIPGLEFVEIELKENEVVNLTNNDFTNISGYANHPLFSNPAYKQWIATQFPVYTGGDGYDYNGFRSDTYAEASMGYSFYEEYTPKYPGGGTAITNYLTGKGKTYGGIQNAMLRYDVPYRYIGGSFWEKTPFEHGIATKFKLTVESAETKLGIKWKYMPIHVDCDSALGSPKDYEYRCRWTLRVLPDQFNWIIENTDGDEPYWEYKYIDNYHTGYYQYKEISGGDLNESGYAEINIDIPIGDVSGWITEGDAEMVLTIYGEEIRKAGETTWGISDDDYVLMAAYGDVEITAERGNDKTDNKIIAQINNNVLNSEKVSFNIFDAETLLLNNGPRTGGSPSNRFTERTSLWNEDGDTTQRSIVNWYIHDRFQLYNRNRRQIKGTILYPGYIKPLSPWWDEYDPSTRKYILSAYSYNVGADTYDCTWMEYDNTDEINIGTDTRERPKTLVDPASTRTGRRSPSGNPPRGRTGIGRGVSGGTYYGRRGSRSYSRG